MISPIHEEFATLILSLRKERGVSQEKLSGELGITQSRVGLLERGDKDPFLSEIIKFAQYFNLEIKIGVKDECVTKSGT